MNTYLGVESRQCCRHCVRAVVVVDMRVYVRVSKRTLRVSKCTCDVSGGVGGGIVDTPCS